MSALSLRYRSLLLALACASVVGCDDKSVGDKAVIDNLTSARVQLDKLDASQIGTSPKMVEPVNAKLVAAAGDKAASPVWQAVGAGATADLNLTTAMKARLALTDTELKVRTILGHLRVLSQQATLVNQTAVAYQNTDPKEIIASIDGRVSAIKGSAEKTTWQPGSAEGIKVPTLSAAEADAKALKGKIADRQAKIEELNKQRADAILSAQKLFAEADKQKGDESVRTYTEGTVARKKGDDLAYDIMLVQDGLQQHQADLLVAEGQTKAMAAAAATLAEQSATVSEGWNKTQKVIVDQKSLVSRIASGGGEASATATDTTATPEATAGSPAADTATPDATNPVEKVPYNIEAQSAALAVLLDKADKQRQEVGDLLDVAEKYYTTAAQSSKSFASSIAPRVTAGGEEAKAWSALSASISGSRYQLGNGIVLRERASLAANQTQMLHDINLTRAAVQTALGGASLSTPETLKSVESSELLTLSKSAEAKYKEASDMLTNAEQGNAAADVKASAMVARLITLDNLISLLQLQSTIGDPNPSQEEQRYRTDAADLKNQIIAANIPLPRLPGEFGEGPPPVAPPVQPVTPPAGTPGETPPGATPGTTTPGGEGPMFGGGGAPAAAGGAASDGAGDSEAISKTKIDEAINSFAAAMVAGDEDNIRDGLVDEPEGKAAVDAIVANGKALARLEASAVARLPDLKDTLRKRIEQGLAGQQISTQLMEIKGDTAMLLGDATVRLRRINGQWKLIPATSEADGSDSVAAVKQKVVKLETISDQLDNGQITTQAQLEQALQTLAK